MIMMNFDSSRVESITEEEKNRQADSNEETTKRRGRECMHATAASPSHVCSLSSSPLFVVFPFLSFLLLPLPFPVIQFRWPFKKGVRHRPTEDIETNIWKEIQETQRSTDIDIERNGLAEAEWRYVETVCDGKFLKVHTRLVVTGKLFTTVYQAKL